MNFLQTYFPNVMEIPDEFIQATIETLYMSFWSSLIGGILGVFFGVILVVSIFGITIYRISIYCNRNNVIYL